MDYMPEKTEGLTEQSTNRTLYIRKDLLVRGDRFAKKHHTSFNALVSGLLKSYLDEMEEKGK